MMTFVTCFHLVEKYIRDICIEDFGAKGTDEASQMSKNNPEVVKFGEKGKNKRNTTFVL